VFYYGHDFTNSQFFEEGSMIQTKAISFPAIGLYKHLADYTADGWEVVGVSVAPEGPAFTRVTLRRDDAPAEAPQPPAAPKPVAKIKPKKKSK